MKLCRGITAAVVTPFTKSEAVNYKELRRHVQRIIEAGVHGIFCLGTNGEFYALSEREKYRVVETVVDEVSGKVPVYAGSGEIATRTVIRLTKRFKKLGADAVSIVTPYFIHPTQHELYHHYGRIAVETEFPIILYNIPMRTNVKLEPETVARLAAGFENIIGIKDSSGDLKLTQAYIEQTPERFAVMGGNDGLILDTLLLGGTGAIAATANVIPEILVNIYQAFMEGDLDKARMWQDRVAPLRKDFALGTSPGVIKVQANQRGYPVGPSRMPILYDDPEVVALIGENLRQNYGLAD
ncbi:MAG: 4-hydroxy-tetrahydrodipicolinate synthase [Limnochordia bacterium]|nr:4-hydroxy-tetrahydrodipicolinate synthase [Bacillota bacterium]HOB08520.1 4-hydroxy-tetrahydrodipicolinate synthase [Limnochordia bacterium]NLH30678.1 4-hydroxy-tetrahydrodipicolinate synthase [Bacillota bacterium]HPT93053.1 4-hydroxy-tetrahydrodipicolinate synthase [Limnochordia bacterium]HPZ30661.1 4-hydroxy-tetrahydrodipicolinate synthase [Limnochordia bacterium]